MSNHSYGSGDLISIDLYCPECNLKTWDTLPKSEATYENRWDCPSCGATQSVKRIPSAPMVAKASYPDGYKRRGFQDLKEAANLEVERMSMPLAERTQVKSEIDRLEQRIVKK